MEIIHWNAAQAAIALDLYRCIKRRQCDAHIRWMRGDAALGRAQNRVDSIKPADRIATRPGCSFIATGSFVVKVIAPGALHQVAPGSRHISDLSGCAEQYRLREQRVTLPHEGMIRHCALPDRRAYREAAVGQCTVYFAGR